MDDNCLKEKINAWFMEEENVLIIRSFLKSLIFKKIIEEDKKKYENAMEKEYDNLDVTLTFLISDFLLQNNFHYSLSVFSSEILLTNSRNHFSDYFKKISYNWDPRKPPTLDYTTVRDILRSVALESHSCWEKDLLERYYTQSEGGLLKLIIKLLSKSEIQQKPTGIKTFSSSINYKNGIEETNNRKIEILKRKEKNMKKQAILNKKEFTWCRKVITSSHEALKLKLEGTQRLIEELSQLKDDINKEVEFSRDQQKFIDDINTKVTSLTSYLDKLQDFYVANPRYLKENNKFDTSKIFKDFQSQTQISIRHKQIQTNQTQTKHISIQTDDLNNEMNLKDIEKERMELLMFIDNQQERINALTEKVDGLNSIAISAQLEKISYDGNANHEKKSIAKPPLSSTCSCHELNTSFSYYDYSFKLIKNKFVLLKKQLQETDKKYSVFLQNG